VSDINTNHWRTLYCHDPAHVLRRLRATERELADALRDADNKVRCFRTTELNQYRDLAAGGYAVDVCHLKPCHLWQNTRRDASGSPCCPFDVAPDRHALGVLWLAVEDARHSAWLEPYAHGQRAEGGQFKLWSAPEVTCDIRSPPVWVHQAGRLEVEISAQDKEWPNRVIWARARESVKQRVWSPKLVCLWPELRIRVERKLKPILEGSAP